MKKNIFILSLIVWLAVLSLSAQIPAGYYNSAIGKKNAELKTALHLIIKNANVPDYGSGAGSTWAAFVYTDKRPEDGTVWDMYSNNHVAFSGTSAASGMNIEHSFAKSWWGGGRQAAQDIQHLCPSNSTANSAKGSWPMAVVDGTTTFSNGCIKVGKSGSRPGGVIDAWEPADEYKGDFARMYMYMVTAYEDYAADWTGNSVNQLDNNTYPVFEQWTVDLLLKWSRQDPVSQKEITRTNEAYKIQGNRNPYIDYPLLAEYVWGNMTTVPFTTDGNVDFPYIISPLPATVVDFGKVVYQHTDTASFYLKAAKLTGDLTLAVSGANASEFSVKTTTVAKAAAEAGCIITVDYSAQTTGVKTAILTISGGGIATAVLNLQAVSSDEFLALPATNVSTTGFTANWTVSAGAQSYQLNVYVLQTDGTTESKTLLEEDFINGLPDTWSSVTYVDNSLASNMRLASGSNSGKITTPALNLSSASELTVRAKQYSNDAGAQLTATADGQSLAVWTTSAANQDFKVSVPALTATSTISLTANSGRRVYVDYVKVATQGTKLTEVAISGYPANVGNNMSFAVSGLEAGKTYYYTVSPAGNAAVKTNVVSVNTLLSGIDKFKIQPVKWRVTDTGIALTGLSRTCRIVIMDIAGKQIGNYAVTTDGITLNLPGKGIYIIRIMNQTGIDSYKVLY